MVEREGGRMMGYGLGGGSMMGHFRFRNARFRGGWADECEEWRVRMLGFGRVCLLLGEDGLEGGYF